MLLLRRDAKHLATPLKSRDVGALYPPESSCPRLLKTAFRLFPDYFKKRYLQSVMCQQITNE